LHAITDTSGRPIRRFITAGKVSDDIGAADRSREALVDKGKKHRISGRKTRKNIVKYDKRRYKRRNRIERMFGKLKD
jgi:transposase